MTPNEKGYFKKYVSKYSSTDTDLLKLFGAIDKMNVYDDGKLKKQFANTKLLQHISVSKNQLFQSIITSLRSYHKDARIEDEILDILHDAEILIEKTLYLESLEILNKAKDIAIKFEKHPLLLEIFNYIYRVNLFIKKDKNDFGIWQNDYDKLQLMALYHQEKLITTKKYLMEIRFLCSTHITQKNNVKKKLLAILDRLYEIKKDSDSCISVTMNVYAGLNIIYFYLGEVNKAFETNLQYIEFIESKPDSIEILGKQNLIACFNNTLIYALILKKYNQFTIILEKLYAIESNSIKEKDMIFRTASLVETAYYIRTLQIEKGMKYLKQTEEEIIERPEKHDKSYLIAIYDNISILYFLSGNFSKSLFWSNKIINDEGNMRGEIKNLN